LWVSQHGTEQGLDSAAALSKAGMIAGVSQTAAFLWAPVIGVLADRMHRVSALALSLALAAVGYSSMYFIRNPTGGAMIAGVCLIGVGEISALISSQVLIAERAPARARGSVIGAFGLCGALGILVATKVGGHLFDGWAKCGPFVLMGGLNLLVLIWAMVVRVRYAHQASGQIALPQP
jgi:MFS family permease